MKPLIYFCSNGLGENLCQTPIIRYLAEEYEVSVVCPDNCAILFRDLPHVLEVITWTQAGFKEYGDGAFHTKYLDGCNWVSGHYNFWNGVGRVEFKDEIRGDYITSYFARILGKDIITKLNCNDVTMDPPGHIDMPGISSIDVTIFEGSTEPLRHLSSEYGMKLYSLLRKRGFDVSYFTAGEKGEEAFNRINTAIQRSKLVVTPDSGPLHLALSHGCNVLALPTRELAENIINPVYYPQTHIWTMPAPECDLQCQGARFQVENNMPRGYRRPMAWLRGIDMKENYPLCLNCWGKRGACLKLSDADVIELGDVITSIQEHGHAGKAQPCSTPLGEESLPEAGPALTQPQPS